ncbi:hypothetical protein Rcae01_06571 [Novipirellula caenicola]|uniref:Uncharacterized protein n=1 Tax=Novipirellula caenicola TaxID=1536901 RepID=A0ABP9W540_9BACT
MPTFNGSYLCIEFRLPSLLACLSAEVLLLNRPLANNSIGLKSMCVRH